MSWTWPETRPAGDVNKNWVQVAMSADGLTILAASTTGLYLTVDGGANWTEESPTGSAGQEYRCVAVSGDGTYLLAGQFGARLWLSTDAGANWTEIRPRGDTNQLWNACAIASGGVYLLAAIYSGPRCVSADSGANWTLGASYWRYTSCAMSSDGKYQLLCADTYSASEGDTANAVWRSVDYGANWVAIRFDPWTKQGNWIAVAVSQQGDTMMAGSYDKTANAYLSRLWVSFDFGGHWERVEPTGSDDTPWRGLSCSYHGIHALACNTQSSATGLRLWGTNDGKNWGEQRPAGDADAVWYSTAMSGLGEQVVAVVYGGRMWLGSLPALPTPAFTSCYWDTDTSGQATSAGTAAGKTTAQMETVGTFVDWDFTNVWNEPDSCYPWLRTEHVAVRNGCAVVHSFPWIGKFQLSHVTA